MPIAVHADSGIRNLAIRTLAQTIRESMACGSHGDEQRIAVVESAATHRFGLATWHHYYAARFPGQTRYRLPTKR